MPDDSPDVNRRKVLSTTAAGLGALALSGAASADPGKGRGITGEVPGEGREDHEYGGTGGQVEVELVEGHMVANPPEHAKAKGLEAARAEGRRVNDGSDEHTTPPGFQDRLDDLSQAAEDGLYDVYENEDGEVMIELNEDEFEQREIPGKAKGHEDGHPGRGNGRGAGQ